MNVEQQHSPTSGDGITASDRSDEAASALSALADGELDAGQTRALLDSLPTQALGDWHAYQVLGNVLRGQMDLSCGPPANAFLAAVRSGVERDRDRDLDRMLPKPFAADETVRPVAGHATGVAANDAVFRWKLVAGLASLSAVMAVSWSVMVAPVSGGGSGAQLASNAPVMATPVSSSAPTGAAVTEPVVIATPVAVSTEKGVLIRDAQLEALLAEHRQHGGMSALQMPTGFIRNATYDAEGR